MLPPFPWVPPVGEESGPEDADAATAAATAAAVAAAAAAAACETDAVAIDEIGGDAGGTAAVVADFGEVFDCVSITLLCGVLLTGDKLWYICGEPKGEEELRVDCGECAVVGCCGGII